MHHHYSIAFHALQDFFGAFVLTYHALRDNI